MQCPETLQEVGARLGYINAWSLYEQRRYNAKEWAVIFAAYLDHMERFTAEQLEAQAEGWVYGGIYGNPNYLSIDKHRELCSIFQEEELDRFLPQAPIQFYRLVLQHVYLALEERRIITWREDCSSRQLRVAIQEFRRGEVSITPEFRKVAHFYYSTLTRHYLYELEGTLSEVAEFVGWQPGIHEAFDRATLNTGSTEFILFPAVFAAREHTALS